MELAAGGGRQEAMPSSPSTNNAVLNTLASRTGAFPSLNKNTLLEGMKEASAEMDESYILGYVPPNPVHDGRYHKIQVKVDRSGAEVRARNGYFDTKGQDILAGKPEGSVLEAQAASSEAGQIPVALCAPYFYVQPDTARVNLALSFPASALVFEKRGDTVHAQVDILGIAYRGDGSIAARFSDTMNLDYRGEELPEVTKTSIHYQNTFKIAPGEYTFKLVLGAGGGKFGKSVMPLGVDPFSGKEIMLSGPAFGDRVVAASPGSAEMDLGLPEGSEPMVAKGMKVVPSSNNHFKKETEPVFYVEVYDPLLQGSNQHVGIAFTIVNSKTNQLAYSSQTLPLSVYVRPGNPLVPVIFKLPMNKLPEGDYLMEIRGGDSAGNLSPVRSGDFSIE